MRLLRHTQNRATGQPASHGPTHSNQSSGPGSAPQAPTACHHATRKTQLDAVIRGLGSGLAPSENTAGTPPLQDDQGPVSSSSGGVGTSASHLQNGSSPKLGAPSHPLNDSTHAVNVIALPSNDAARTRIQDSLLRFPLPPQGHPRLSDFATPALTDTPTQDSTTFFPRRELMDATSDVKVLQAWPADQPPGLPPAHWHAFACSHKHTDGGEDDFEPAWSDTLSATDPVPFYPGARCRAPEPTTPDTVKLEPAEPSRRASDTGVSEVKERWGPPSVLPARPVSPPIDAPTAQGRRRSQDARYFEFAALKRQVEQLQYLLAKRAGEDDAAAAAAVDEVHPLPHEWPLDAFQDHLAASWQHQQIHNHATYMEQDRSHDLNGRPIPFSGGAGRGEGVGPEPLTDMASLARKIADLEAMVQGRLAVERRGTNIDAPTHLSYASHAPYTATRNHGFDVDAAMTHVPPQFFVPFSPGTLMQAQYPLYDGARAERLPASAGNGRSQPHRHATAMPMQMAPQSSHTSHRVHVVAQDSSPAQRGRTMSSSTASTRQNFSYNVTPSVPGPRQHNTSVRASARTRENSGKQVTSAERSNSVGRNSNAPSASSSLSSGRRVAFMPPAQIFLDGDNRPLIFRDGRYISLSQAYPEPVYKHGQSSSSTSRPQTGSSIAPAPTSISLPTSPRLPPTPSRRQHGESSGGGLHQMTLAGLIGKAARHKKNAGGMNPRQEEILEEDAGSGLGAGKKMVVGPGRGRMLVKRG
ncbi:unnamed protein product [Parajaminaea phylloscopi]